MTYSLRQYQFLPLTLAILLLVIASLFSAISERKFSQVEGSWLKYAEHSSKLDRLMLDTQNSMGYGGLIHNFKNLIIRKDLEKYGTKIEKNFVDLKHSLALLQYELHIDADKIHLLNIQSTIEDYYSKYQIAKNLIENNHGTEQIDKFVKVDDSLAFESFEYLENRIQERLDQIKISVEKEYSEALRFLWFSRLIFLISFIIAVIILYRYHSRFAFLSQEAFKVKGVVDSMQIGLWEIDIQSPRMSKWNETCSKIFETPPEFKVDRDSFVSFFKYGKNFNTINNAIHEAVKEGNSFQVELEVITYKNNLTWVKVEGIPLLEDGKLLKVFGLIEDISAKKKLEQELISMRDQALEASIAKSEFLTNMSHELRTPLNAIIGFSQLLENDTALSTDQKEDIEHIHKAGKHLLNLINDILDFSSIDAGKLSISIEPVDINSAVQNSITLLKGLARTKNIHIECQNLEGIYVRADFIRLKQVLINLLSNAIKYNHEGGMVIFKADVQGSYVRLNVIDNGLGIEDKKIPLLFQPFNRLGRENLAIQGTGIGLSLTKKLVNVMGGSIGVTSSLNKGSCFWIDLPLESIIQQQTQSDSNNTKNKLKIELDKTALYIEDNPTNINLMEAFIERETSLKLITADRPELGLKLAQSKKPDLILLDINLPEIDGYQVLKQLKQDKTTSHIPVIAITANAMPEDIKKGKSSGFSDYITKPIDFGALAESIKRIL